MWVLLVAGMAGTSHAGEIDYFATLYGTSWSASLGFRPAASDTGDWSFKVFDSAGALRFEQRIGYGFAAGGPNSHSFEELVASAYTVQFRPSGIAQTSVYHLTVDAAGWSGAALPAPRPTLSGSLHVDDPLIVTWPVFEGTGNAVVSMIDLDLPNGLAYLQDVPYAAGGLVTDGLPLGFGSVELNYGRMLGGASVNLELLSGPVTNLALSAGVRYASTESAGFEITVPEPTSTVWVVAAIAAVVRRGRVRRRRRVGVTQRAAALLTR